MAAPKHFFVLFFVLLLCSIDQTQGRGGRGGGSRGGGSRGSSSSGSRGSSSSGSRGSSSSSSSSSGSRGSSSSGSNWDRSGSSSSNKPSPPKSSIDHPKPPQAPKPQPPKPSAPKPEPPKPSAPELPSVNPSAPKLPSSPGHSQPSNAHPYNPNYGQPSNAHPYNPNYGQPSNPHPYNPNYGQPANPQPDTGARVNQPTYGNAPGNPPPYSPRENPPPYSPGNPAPYPLGSRPPYPPGNPPPYPQGNPPAYGSGPPGNPPLYPQGNHPQYGSGPPGYPPLYPQGNHPQYGSGPPGNPPPYAPSPAGVNPGNIPQGTNYGQPPYGGVNRPNIPHGNPPPYGVNPGLPGHGVQPGNIPHPGQPSNFPYPRQPGMSYPPGGSGWPNYYYPPGGIQGNPNIKSHKKKGLLGGLFSFGKKPKHHGISSPVGSFGAPSIGGHGISPVHMLFPVAAKTKSHKPFSKHHYWMLPFVAAYGGRKWGGIDLDLDDDDDDYYRRRCFRPRPPIGGSVTCTRSLQKLECTANCPDGFTFPDNSTQLEARCWHFSGHWSRSRFLPRCQPYCKPEECQNGGTCKAPGQCLCASEYRGDHCEHSFLNCDILKFARGSKISWVCSHSRNETLCRVRCRSPLVFETPASEQGTYHCHLNGTWTPDHIPQCVEEARSTEAAQTTTLLTETPQEG